MEVLISTFLPVINDAKLAKKGLKPDIDNPAAIPTALASAIPISKDLFGNLLKKKLNLHASFKSQLTATIFLFFLPIFTNSFPNASLILNVILAQF